MNERLGEGYFAAPAMPSCQALVRVKAAVIPPRTANAECAAFTVER